MGKREDQIHIAIINYLRRVLPVNNIVQHSPNGDSRAGRSGMIGNVRANKMGQIAGWPDIMVVRYQPLPLIFFEIKAPGKYPEPRQREVHEALRGLGCRVAVVRSLDDVRAALTEWDVPTQDKTVTIPLEGETR